MKNNSEIDTIAIETINFLVEKGVTMFELERLLEKISSIARSETLLAKIELSKKSEV